MRKATLVLTALILVARSQGAMALNTEDSMAAWAAASDQDRSDVVDEIMAKATMAGQISRSDLVDCLNAAASVGGHAQLPIGEIAHACSHPSDLEDDGKAGTGI